MPRYGPFIHQVYIADGFADDCDELIHRCLNIEKVDYHSFCHIWKEMKIGCLYEGRTLGAEIAELSEEVIHIGKHYMLRDTSNFEESVIGTFIVYALLHLQPYKGFAHLRLVPEDLPAINRIEHVARRDKRYDVLYALGSILIKGPVQYHAADREYGMDLPVRKYLEGFTSIDKLGVRPKGVFRRQNEELDILKELNTVTQKYTQAKMMISEKAQFDRGLKYINSNVPKILETALMKLITGIQEDQYDILGSFREDADKILKSRRAIKDKAMKEGVKPVKHLENIESRKTTTATGDSPKEEGKRRSKKRTKKKIIRENVLISKEERKRRIPISPRALKKNRNQMDCIEEQQSKVEKESTSESDESDSNVIGELKTDIDDLESVALSERVKAGTEASAEDKGNDKKTCETEEVNEHVLDIQIDTLPVLIRTEDDGKLFEIEIIDKISPEKKVGRPVKSYKKKETALQKISSLPGVSIEKVKLDAIEPVASTSTADQFASIVGLDEGSKKNDGKTSKAVQDKVLGVANSKEKRDYKRVHIKSKFKRLGMLPVANFKVAEVIAPEIDEEEDTNDGTQENVGLPIIDD